MTDVIGEHISVNVAPEPAEGETCDKCGADASHFVKHPALIGGNCDACGGIWLPAMTFGPPEPIYADQIQVVPTADGGAVLHFDV